MYTYISIHTYVCVYIYIYIERERDKDKLLISTILETYICPKAAERDKDITTYFMIIMILLLLLLLLMIIMIMIIIEMIITIVIKMIVINLSEGRGASGRVQVLGQRPLLRASGSGQNITQQTSHK